MRMSEQENTSERSVDVNKGIESLLPQLSLGKSLLCKEESMLLQDEVPTDQEGNSFDLEQGATNDDLETRVEEHVDEHPSEEDEIDEGSEGSDQDADARDGEEEYTPQDDDEVVDTETSEMSERKGRHWAGVKMRR